MKIRETLHNEDISRIAAKYGYSERLMQYDDFVKIDKSEINKDNFEDVYMIYNGDIFVIEYHLYSNEFELDSLWKNGYFNIDNSFLVGLFMRHLTNLVDTFDLNTKGEAKYYLGIKSKSYDEPEYKVDNFDKYSNNFLEQYKFSYFLLAYECHILSRLIIDNYSEDLKGEYNRLASLIINQAEITILPANRWPNIDYLIKDIDDLKEITFEDSKHRFDDNKIDELYSACRNFEFDKIDNYMHYIKDKRIRQLFSKFKTMVMNFINNKIVSQFYQRVQIITTITDRLDTQRRDIKQAQFNFDNDFKRINDAKLRTKKIEKELNELKDLDIDANINKDIDKMIKEVNRDSKQLDKLKKQLLSK